ncbi:DUF469 family protein [Shewanella sp. JM162201]|uniref:DUF469 family protein n=1 Tax=Shewanella jiangmenensis TaxID=2837387 RepID=A0ABS5V5G3_9GAMM|nr:50S ribosome-binding protein YggL [Shewanella jiangmenensis]MBT1445694.1 DUF469 family protein [Shewanella jiangmenensis]
MASIKKRRLRKKLYLEEFAVYGFEFSCDLNLNTECELDSFFDQLLDLVENRELCMGGWGTTKTFEAFICSNSRYSSATNDDREAIKDFLHSKNFISNVVVGQLVDANYGI